LVLEGGEWSTVHPSHFTLSTHSTGGRVGSRAGLDVSKTRSLSPATKQTLDHPTHCLVTTLTTIFWLLTMMLQLQNRHFTCFYNNKILHALFLCFFLQTPLLKFCKCPSTGKCIGTHIQTRLLCEGCCTIHRYTGQKRFGKIAVPRSQSVLRIRNHVIQLFTWKMTPETVNEITHYMSKSKDFLQSKWLVIKMTNVIPSDKDSQFCNLHSPPLEKSTTTISTDIAQSTEMLQILLNSRNMWTEGRYHLNVTGMKT